MTYANYIRREEKEEEDLLVLKIGQMHQYKDSRISLKRINASGCNMNDNIRINKATKTRKQKWKEKQLYGYFKQQNDKISHEKTWNGYEWKLLEKTWISSNSSTKQRHKDQLC